MMTLISNDYRQHYHNYHDNYMYCDFEFSIIIKIQLLHLVQESKIKSRWNDFLN